jgi:hypothetical protein
LVIQPQAPQAQPQQPAGQNGRDQQLATLGKSTATEVYVREQQPAPGASGSETATKSPVENEPGFRRSPVFYHLDRGFERIEDKLGQCGVQIERLSG